MAKKPRFFYSPAQTRELKDLIAANPERKSLLSATKVWSTANNRPINGVLYKVRTLTPNYQVKTPGHLVKTLVVENTKDFTNGSLTIPIKSLHIVNNNLVIAW